MKIDFSRSNVNDGMLNVTQPRKSSFDLYHKHHHSLPVGRFIPVNVQSLMPDTVVSGVIKPSYTLEKVVTPDVGPLRFDTHTIAVSARRINRDWRKLIEDNANVQNIPSFDAFIPFNIVSELLFSDHRNAFSFLIGEDFADLDLGTVDLYGASLRVVDSLNQSLSLRDRTGYLDDFISSEISRLMASPYITEGNLKVWTVRDLASWLHFILLPFVGEGSICDELGYLCFGRFCPLFTVIDILMDASYDRSSGAFDSQFFQLILDLGDDFSRLCDLDGSYPNFTLVLADPFECNEMLLRASYAAWYDALRNWHVEERKNILDPDDWGASSVVSYSMSIWAFLQLFIPRYRCFGSDPFTSIQTDDVFRHVFAPIMPDAGPDTRSNYTSSDSQESDYDSIYQVMIAGISKVFPQGLFRRNTSEQVREQNYLLDLQTMKRTGMLERYLARNYYFPDTYEGQMRARYGIDASDLLGCTSRYISGSESFLTGEQQISNVSTSEMESGTRVYTGGSASTETVQFASQGDFIYLVTFASILPVPTYDSYDPHLAEISRADLPFPEFADDTRVQISAADLIRNVHNRALIGYVPRYYQYRAQLDSVHGKYLSDYRSFIWLRDWYSAYGANLKKSVESSYNPLVSVSPFTIDAYGLHVHVPMDAFLGVVHEFDPIAYGNIEFNLASNCPLPAAVETI